MAASLVAIGSPADAAGAARPDEEMVIGVVAANGSGCPWGSAQVTPSPDNKAFTVTYSEFTAQVGVGTKPTDFRKNCQLALDVHVPQGYTYAISGTDYRGFAHLERGASASETANYYFQGERQSTRIRHDFSGPFDGNWQRTDSVGISSLAFLPCGEQRYLNVNTELRVNAGSSNTKKTTSMLTMDSTDGRIDTVYHVAWKKC
ncbi:DUF4360 domain-containing protein [Actinoplanes sp. URMC 104]|uniref:DUF4360 domain-containing protein n=1 Tax=Actinoplanes sp. URMC 104 TaxID=3423409 RepID=UPI003F1C3E2D